MASLAYYICAAVLIFNSILSVCGDDPVNCVLCTSVENPENCNTNAVDTKIITTTCPIIEAVPQCVTFTFRDPNSVDTVYTTRACALSCAAMEQATTSVIGWNCTSCNTNLCNADEIVSPNSGFSCKFSLISLLLSCLVAIYCY